MTEPTMISRANADQILTTYSAVYPFSDIPGQPPAAFRVRSASMARINRWREASSGKSSNAVWKAMCDLIAESVIDEDGEPIWSGAAVQEMSKSNAKRFMDLQLGVLNHNGLNRESMDLDPLIDSEAKN